MSKLVCNCGHIIVDQADKLPYKASLLKDVTQDDFFDWLVAETQSYVDAVTTGVTRQWILSRGYSAGYADLRLPHGHVLHDHIHARYLKLKKDVYECTSCGRLLVEGESNSFEGYAPDKGSVMTTLADNQPVSAGSR